MFNEKNVPWRSLALQSLKDNNMVAIGYRLMVHLRICIFNLKFWSNKTLICISENINMDFQNFKHEKMQNKFTFCC